MVNVQLEQSARSAAVQDGVDELDFEQILSDMGITVSYQVSTMTTDPLTGVETTSFAAAVSQVLVFFLKQNRNLWDKEGVLSVGDAYVIAPISTGIKRYDRFTVTNASGVNNSYYIDNITRRTVLTTDVSDFGVCFLVA